MTVPLGCAVLYVIAGVSAIWIFYVAWRDAYPVDEFVWVDEALTEDAQWAGIEAEWHTFLDEFGVRS